MTQSNTSMGLTTTNRVSLYQLCKSIFIHHLQAKQQNHGFEKDRAVLQRCGRASCECSHRQVVQVTANVAESALLLPGRKTCLKGALAPDWQRKCPANTSIQVLDLGKIWLAAFGTFRGLRDLPSCSNNTAPGRDLTSQP